MRMREFRHLFLNRNSRSSLPAARLSPLVVADTKDLSEVPASREAHFPDLQASRKAERHLCERRVHQMRDRGVRFRAREEERAGGLQVPLSSRRCTSRPPLHRTRTEWCESLRKFE